MVHMSKNYDIRACDEKLVAPTVDVVLRHFHQHYYYNNNPLWFVVGGTKALLRSS
jgi:hypothetical protein